MDLSFLMVFLKKYFFHPAGRQNFGNASGKLSSQYLTQCHMYENDNDDDDDDDDKHC